MEWGSVTLQGIATALAAFVAVSQFRWGYGNPRAALKADLEILQLMKPDDGMRYEVEDSIRVQLIAIYGSHVGLTSRGVFKSLGLFLLAAITGWAAIFHLYPDDPSPAWAAFSFLISLILVRAGVGAIIDPIRDKRHWNERRRQGL